MNSKVKDLTGKKFERLTVIKRVENSKNGKTIWECRCDCGTIILAIGTNLVGGNTKSCGCLQKEKAGKNKIKTDIRGKRFGKLIAIEYGKKNKNGQRMWKCQCDCGNVCYVIFNHLNSGATKSCGCWNKEKICRKDLTGKKFGKLTVIKYSHTLRKIAYWECKCECGNSTIVTSSSLVTKNTRSCGCGISRGNDKIDDILTYLNIYFEREKRFKDCTDKRSLSFDFYLPIHNLLIEYQGQQHYHVVAWSNSDIKNEENFRQNQIHDQIKRDYCQKNNIRLLEIKYTNYDKIEEILKKELLTIKEKSV